MLIFLFLTWLWLVTNKIFSDEICSNTELHYTFHVPALSRHTVYLPRIITIMNETKEAKLARKQEAKMLKRQRIEAAGGKRPRTEKPKSSNMNTNSNNNKRKRGGGSSKSKKNNDTHHRFGRVMEHAPCPNQARLSTLSIAIPGSIVSNAQTQELRTHLVGQIARAAAIYHVDEIVVFNDRMAKDIKPHYRYNRRRNDDNGDKHDENGDNTVSKDEKQKKNDDGKNNNNNNMQPSVDPHAFMARVLQYCECPQYLRRNFFPMHPDLQFAGLLAPLDAPHHVRALDRSEFREGVVLDKLGNGSDGSQPGSLVYCGIRNQNVE